MKIRLGLLAVVALLATSVGVLAPGATAASPATGSTITAPISTSTASGVFTITSFAVNSAGQLVASGTFTGTVQGVLGTVTTLATSVVSSSATSGSCTILDLTLGPLHLDLLGLVVDLNQVHLQITAQPGPGNLLGNLLCAVTHLLDNTSAGSNAVQSLVDLLNRLLA